MRAFVGPWILVCLLALVVSRSSPLRGQLYVDNLTVGTFRQGGGPQEPDATNHVVTLPVEVLGYLGATQTVAFTLSAPVTALELTLNNHHFQGKGSLAINGGGGWLVLSNANVQFTGLHSNFGGFNPAQPNVTFRVPAALAAGNHTITLRYPRTLSPTYPGGVVEDTSVGYTLIGFRALDAGGVNRAAVTWTNPASYTFDPALVDLGAKLWRGTNAANEPFALLNPAPSLGGETMTATCADCHSPDGFDLALFWPSPLRVAERAKLHGILGTNADAVAAYIVSRTNFPRAADARIWTQMLQPGAGIDSRPATEWYAGAGEAAQLHVPELVLNALHPGLVSGTAGNLTWNTNALRETNLPPHRYISPREAPDLLPFPAWQRWLPEIHPKDALADTTNRARVLELVTLMESAAAAGNRTTWRNLFNEFFALQPVLFTENGHTAWSTNQIRNRKLMALSLWGVSQLFLQHQRHPTLLTNWGAIYGERAEPMAFEVSQFFFDRPSPDITKMQAGYTGLGDQTSEVLWRNAWYRMQMLANMGHRKANYQMSFPWQGLEAGQPIDVAYQFAAIRGLAELMNYSTLSQHYLWLVFLHQFYDTGAGPERGYNERSDGVFQAAGGWNFRNSFPLALLWYHGYPSEPVFFGETPAAVRAGLMETLALAWLAKSTNYTVADYRLGSPATGVGSMSPPPGAPSITGITSCDEAYAAVVRNGYWGYAGWGVSTSTQNALRAFFRYLWPEKAEFFPELP